VRQSEDIDELARSPFAPLFHFWDTQVNRQADLKELVWLGSSLRDMREFPEAVRQVMGFALYLAQTGAKHPAAVPLRGFGGAGVLEVRDDCRGDTYRGIFAVRFADAVYVLHAFKKRAKRGRATPKRDIDLVRGRLAQAARLSAQRLGSAGDHE
jgi:phage-related protein